MIEQQDLLGDGWLARTLSLTADDEGDVVATLVRRSRGLGSERAVLYVHGFVDYFFQTHVADAFVEHGYDFYALDLRKYGRSLRPYQTPNYVTDLAAYDEELDRSLALLREEFGHRRIVLMGHSTGGLVAALYGNRRPRTLSALVHNSPWFDLNGTLFQRTVLTQVVRLLATFAPKHAVSAIGPWYGRSLHRSYSGAWDYDLALKPILGFPVRAAWISAIRRGQARLARGLAIDCPVLVCCSAASGRADRWHEAIGRTDSVLNVDDMVRLAPRLGQDVTVARIPDGVHDLALSAEPARQAYFAEIFGWLERHVDSS